MRINIYNEDISNHVEILEKTAEGVKYIGLRFYLYLPVIRVSHAGTISQIQGPFVHNDGDNDSSAVTFWFYDIDKAKKFLLQANNILLDHEVPL